jgi:hypothetical protein
VQNISWLENGDFLLDDMSMPPYNYEALLYFDKNQNKKFTILDSTDEKFLSKNLFSDFSLDDMRVFGGRLVLAYNLNFNDINETNSQAGKFSGVKYYVKDFSLGEDITAAKLFDEKSMFASIDANSDESLANVKLLDEKTISFEKFLSDDQGKARTYLLDLNTKTELYLN